MKWFEKFVCLAVLLCMLMTINVSVHADREELEESVEVVILFDVSGSMTLRADPPAEDGNRLSVEAAQLFALNRLTRSDLYIKVIPYNHQVYTGFNSVNVRDEEGLATYMQYMQDVLNDYEEQDTIPGINCWIPATYTDIGSAMEEAVDAIKQSSCDKKAVILFTDGKVDLPSNSSITEAQSSALAKSSVEELAEIGVEYYTIGLDAGGKGYVDKDFIAELHGVSRIEDSDHIMVIESAEDLTNEFNEIFADLFPETVIVEGDDADSEFELEEDVEEERIVHLFEDAVEEANISLSSTSALKTIKVISPSGQVVADVELTEGGRKQVQKDICSVEYTGMAHSAMIKIFSPMGGDWKIVVTGKSGIVIERKLYSAELLSQDTIPDGGATVYLGEKYTFEAAVYNSAGTHLSTPDIYSQEYQAAAQAIIITAAGGKTQIIDGERNAAGNGYIFEIPTDKVGEFSIELSMEHEIYSLKSVKKLTVVGPELLVDAVKSDEAGTIEVVVRFINPLTGQEILEIPHYLLQQDLMLRVSHEGGQMEDIALELDAFENGQYIYSYIPGASGQYSFYAYARNINETVIESNVDEYAFIQQAVVVSNICSSIQESAFSGGIERIIDFSGCFVDPEGDELTYSVRVEGDDVISAEIDGQRLIVKISDFGTGTVCLIAEDGKGSAATHEIAVKYTSAMGTVIAVIVTALVSLAIICALLILVYCKKIINVSFRVKIERNDPEGNGGEVVYNIVKLSSRKSAKPVMTLKQLLSSGTYSSLLYSSMAGEDVQLFAEQLAEQFVLSGVPFKNQFTITVKDADKKGNARKYTFKSSSVLTKSADGQYLVTFGNRNAFEQSDGFIY